MAGHLILGKRTLIKDITCFDKYAVVQVAGKDQSLSVSYSAISWVSGDWIWEEIDAA